MARKPAASRVAPTPSPVPAVLERLAKLSAAGSAPDRIIRETEASIADWRAEGLSASDWAERMELLRDDLDGGLEAAEEQAADVSRDDKAGIKAATRVVDGLRGAAGAVRVAMEKGGG